MKKTCSVVQSSVVYVCMYETTQYNTIQMLVLVLVLVVWSYGISQFILICLPLSSHLPLSHVLFISHVLSLFSLPNKNSTLRYNFVSPISSTRLSSAQLNSI